jgi:uncharacterized protein YndB with AHSA1/START domain
MSDATPPEGVVSAHSDAEGILIVRVFDAPREPDKVELPFAGTFLEVVEPERVSLTLVDPSDPESGLVEVLTAVLKDLGNDRTEMTFTQRGGSLPADEYSRAMRGSLIFFDRMAEHFGDSLKARHDTA